MKKLVVDVDGVILDFPRAFAEWAKVNKGVDLDPHPKDWDFGWHGSTDVLNDMLDEFIASDAFKSIPLCSPDVVDAVNELMLEFDVYIVSAIPKTSWSNRFINLMNHGINVNYHRFFADPDKLDLIINGIKPIACIEDSPSNIRALVGVGIPVYYPMDVAYIDDETKSMAIGYHSLDEVITEFR